MLSVIGGGPSQVPSRFSVPNRVRAVGPKPPQWEGRTPPGTRSGAGGVQIPFAQIQPNNRMIMNQLKSRLKHNIMITTKLYNQYDQEDRSPAKKEVMSAENAVVRLEKPRTGVMLTTFDLQSDSEYESDDEDIVIAHVYCIRVSSSREVKAGIP